MRRSIIHLSILALVLTVSLGVMMGCSSSDSNQAKQAATMKDHDHAHDHGHDGHQHMAETGLEYVYTADQLYVCPGCPQMISDDSSKECPKCKVNFTELSKDEMADLRTAGVKGCGHCSFVVKKDDETASCPGCKMDLIAYDGKAAHSH